MNAEHFPYIYEQGRWIRNDEPEDGWTLRKVAETVLSCFALGVCLVALAMLFLCAG
jgi:hypothetical protein